MDEKDVAIIAQVSAKVAAEFLASNRYEDWREEEFLDVVLGVNRVIHGIIASAPDSAPEPRESSSGTPVPEGSSSASERNTPACPGCGGSMWDNRESKTNPRAPDFRCKDKICGGVIWPAP